MQHGRAEMTLTWLSDFFSHLCGQGRCFIVDGAALPVCQRCLGLYAGAAVTSAWLLLSGMWRRGFPGRAAVAMEVLALALAILGGVHIIDTGPRWRFACGLWSGHVILLWLAAGAACLRAGEPRDWPRSQNRVALLFPPAMALLAAGAGLALGAGRLVWSAMALAGLAALVVAFLSAVAALVAAAVSRLRMAAHESPRIDTNEIGKTV
jgi:uncharacterized membrane protein